MPSEIDWARLAAFIDGEGYLKIMGRNSSPHCPRLELQQVDKRLIDWLAATFGGTMTFFDAVRYNVNGRDQWRWAIGSHKLHTILRRIRPLLIVKGEQADIILRFYDEMPVLKGGRRIPPDEEARREALRQALKAHTRRGRRDA